MLLGSDPVLDSEWFAKYNAAAPATCGLAMLVPLLVLHFPPFQVDKIQTPGAIMSTQRV
jgi:hypothetical protein